MLIDNTQEETSNIFDCLPDDILLHIIAKIPKYEVLTINKRFSALVKPLVQPAKFFASEVDVLSYHCDPYSAIFYEHVTLEVFIKLEYYEDYIGCAIQYNRFDIVEHIFNTFTLADLPLNGVHAIESHNIFMVMYVAEYILRDPEFYIDEIFNDAANALAIQNDRLDILGYIHHVGGELGTDCIKAAVLSPNIEHLEFLHSINVRDDAEAILLVADTNDLPRMRYLVEHGYRLSVSCIMYAIYNENINMIEYLVQVNAPLYDRVLENAIRSGKLEIVELILSARPVIDVDMLENMCKNDYPEIFAHITRHLGI